MMIGILTLIGILIGAAAGELQGAVIGGILGYLLGDRVALRRRLDQTDAVINELKRRLPSSREPAAEPPAAVRPPIETPPRQGSVPPAAAPATVRTERPAPQTPTEFSRALPPGAAARPARAPQELAILRWVRAYFTGGNLVVRIGALILFFGVAFLLKYAAEHTRLPIELRLIGVCVGAAIILAFGWRLRIRQRAYAVILQGVGVAVLYLVVFAALRLYSLLPAGAAFGLLAAIGLFSAILAVTQNAIALAMMGAAGGFLAPILTSTGQGSHVVLFSYFALLDAGILAIAWYKSWRPLNLLGFIFTFGIGTAWGVLRYRPDQLATTEPFLILFFVFFVVIAVLFAFRQAPRFTHYVDGTIVFGTPVLAFGLQTALVRHIPYALAYSALAASGFYLALAWFLYRRHRENLRLLVEAFLALGVAFATLAVPLALDGRWTAATWALEGAAILWVGLRQNRMLARVSGVLLQIGGGVAFALSSQRAPDLLPVLNSHFLGAVLVSGAGWVSSWLYERARGRVRSQEDFVGPMLFFWGLAWWLFAGLAEIDQAVPSGYFVSASLAFLSVTALGLGFAAHRLGWTLPRIPALCLLPAMILCAVASAWEQAHPLANGGFIAWPLAFAVLYRLLWRHDELLDRLLRTLLHAGTLWLLAAVSSAELQWALEQVLPSGGIWPAIPWGVIPAGFLILLPRLASGGRWPFGVHVDAYLGSAAAGFSIYLVIWSLLVNLSSTGDAAPLTYVPLVNPLDLAQCFVFLAIGSVLARQRALEVSPFDEQQWRAILAVLAATVFVWLNAALLRTLHHWSGVPFELDAMTRSTLVQSALSIFWTILALATMLWATRRAQRLAWIVGAVLMGIVVLKLMFVDLSSAGTVARIVSFLAVGLLMLVLGNFLRIPPTVAPAKS